MKPTTTKPFFITRFFRWLFSWRIMRRLLLTFATLVTLWTLFCAEENWRGKLAWQKYKADLEAKGERLDLASYIPKPVPDEQNFAATPFFKNLFPKPATNYLYDSWSSNYSKANEMITTTNRPKGERHVTDLVAWEQALAAVRAGEKTKHDLEAWQQASAAVVSSEKSKRLQFQTDQLDAASRAQAAPAVLAAFRESEDVLAELRAASARPSSRYFIYYDLENPVGILLPHLGQIKRVVQYLQLKANAELAVDDRDAALADLKLMIYLGDSIREEPFLISWLVRLACFHLTTQPVWEGLAEHRWTEAELSELQNWLQSLDFLEELNRSLDGERGFGVQGMDVFIRGKHGLLALLDGNWLEINGYYYSSGGKLMETARKIFLPIPGWFSLEKISICRMHEEDLKSKFSGKEKRVFRERIKAADLDVGMLIDIPSMSFKGFLQHRMFAKMILPALEKCPIKAANAQVTADQALLACALERHRLAHGQFPENLEALAPQFIAKLPHDPLTGEIYHYRRTDDGQFILYSIGWNGKDDGGTPGKTLWDNENGDWVWRYPAKL